MHPPARGSHAGPQVSDFIDNGVPNDWQRTCALPSSGRPVIPALGLAWASCVNTRLFLTRSGSSRLGGSGGEEPCAAGPLPQDERRLFVQFAPSMPSGPRRYCRFVVEADGFRGLDIVDGS
jgi:DNA-repair protein XRCC3